jgi:hypothetical protein
VQPWNAESPIDVTDEGIEISVNDSQPKKALFFIVVSLLLSGNEISMLLQFLNAPMPIVVTVDGREIFSKLSQLQDA